MVIVLDDYRKSRAGRQTGPAASQRGEQASRGWNVTQGVLIPELPEDFSTIDMKSFFERACALATQI